MRRSGGHDVILWGVFHGTVGGETGSVVDAWRTAGILRRHWGEPCGRARSKQEESLGGGMAVDCRGLAQASGDVTSRRWKLENMVPCLALRFGWFAR